MQPCGEDMARAMAVSEMGILPDTCRSLLRQRPSGGQGQAGDSKMMPDMTDGEEKKPSGDVLGKVNPYPVGHTMGTKDKTGGASVSQSNMMEEDSNDDDDDDGKNGSSRSAVLPWLFLFCYLLSIGLISVL